VTATIAMITMTKHTDNFMIVSLQTGLAKIDSGDVSVESLRIGCVLVVVGDVVAVGVSFF
jgi:hypothetical protein